MQEIHEDKGTTRLTPSHPVSRRTALIVTVLFAAVILGALALMTTSTGQQLAGIKLNPLSSFASDRFDARRSGRTKVICSRSSPCGAQPVNDNFDLTNCGNSTCVGDSTAQLRVTSPSAGEVWKTGEKQTIRWNPKLIRNRLTGGTVSITVSPYYACLSQTPKCYIPTISPYTITSSTSDNGQYTWTIPADLPDQYLLASRINVTGNGRNSPSESSTFQLARVAQPKTATVSGRVLALDGRGLRNSAVSLTDSRGVARTSTTSAFGYFSFDNVSIGETYTVKVLSITRLYRFGTQSVQVSGDITLPDFQAQE